VSPWVYWLLTGFDWIYGKSSINRKTKRRAQRWSPKRSPLQHLQCRSMSFSQTCKTRH